MAAVIGSLDLPGVERQINKDISTWVCKTAIYIRRRRGHRVVHNIIMRIEKEVCV